MATFLKRLLIFMLLPVAVFIATLYRADGRSDPFYLRFTTPRQGSLILGTSRGAQGIQPHVLDSALRIGGRDVSTFNYCFAIGYSNYGRAYYQSVVKKLDPNSKNGVFVLAVDPWSIAGTKGTRNKVKQEDDHSFIASMRMVNMDPNIEYLLDVYDKPFLNILVPDPRKIDDRLLLHRDGWLETDLDLSPKVVEARRLKKMKEYRDTRLNNAVPSAVRLGYLAMTIDLLKQHGTVMLVRLPVHSSMMDLEDELMPQFSRVMEILAASKQINYFDIPVNDTLWSFTDGNHLIPPDGAKVTALIGEQLLVEGK